MPLQLHYPIDPASIDFPLMVVGYGRDRPANLSAACPFLRLEMPPLDKECFEVWAGEEAEYGRSGEIIFAADAQVLFGALSLPDTDNLSVLAENAYREIFAFVAGSAFPHLQRLWNYLPAITEHAGGAERYHLFNAGRHAAFMQQPAGVTSPPAASGVGTIGGGIGIYFMAGKSAAQPIENFRQISAYNYPKEYGPRSPTFSRAAQAMLPEPALLISGTASIVGHTSQHKGDIVAQTEETLRNIAVLLAEAGPAFSCLPLQAKIYLRNPAHKPIVEKILSGFKPGFTDCLYLRADVCRPELLIEIEVALLPAVEYRERTRQRAV